MKLTPETLQVLKNFAYINPGIVIKKGSKLATISPQKTVLAKATIGEVFEKECAIIELPRFLGIYSLLKDPDLEFLNEHVCIREGETVVKFRYGNPSLIAVPPDKDIPITNDVQFTLTSQDFQNVMKAQSTMQLKQIAVKGTSDGIFFTTLDSKNVLGDSFSIKVADASKHTFLFVFDPFNMKFIPDQYDVTLTSKGLMYLKSSTIEYWVPSEKESTFE